MGKDILFFTNEFRLYIYRIESNEGSITNATLLKRVYKRLKSFLMQNPKHPLTNCLCGLFPNDNNLNGIERNLLRKIFGISSKPKYISSITEDEAKLFALAYDKKFEEITTTTKLSWNKPVVNKHTAQKHEHICVQKFCVEGFGQMETMFFSLIDNAKNQINLFLTDAEMAYIFNFLIAIINAKIRNPKLIVNLYYQQTYFEEPRVYKRERMFFYLGINILKIKGIKFEEVGFVGIITDPHSKEAKLLQLTPFKKDEIEYLFLDENHAFMISQFYNSLINCEYEFKEIHTQLYIPEIQEMPLEDYIAIFTKYGEYNSFKDAVGRIKFVEYSLNEIGDFRTFQTHGIKNYKLLQHDKFLLTVKTNQNKLYSLKYINGLNHVINPPVVEIVKSDKYIIEGHTRFYIANENREKNNADKIYAIEVDMKYSKEHIRHETITLNEMIVNEDYPIKYEKSLKRNIEKNTHADQFTDLEWKQLFPFKHEKNKKPK